MAAETQGAAPRRIIVTGASGGIGGAIARRFLGEGATVVNFDLRPPPASLGPDFHSAVVDIASEDSVAQGFAAAERHFGGKAPDVFVHCAAISLANPFLDIPTAEFDRIVATNLRGMFLCCREAGRRMRAAGRGRIVAITSVCAEQAWAGELVYCTTKAAQKALVQGMAVELAPWGILVNAVGPGIVEHKSAGMAETRSNPEVLKHDLDRTPLGRFTRPEEVAEAVRYLAGATATTGQTLYVDGGFLASGLGYFGRARDALGAG